jgi:hypothetical protein
MWVYLSSFLTPTYAGAAAMFPLQLQTQIAAGLSPLQPGDVSEADAQAQTMLVQPNDVAVHCIPLDGGQCRVHIQNLTPSVAAANQQELQAQLSSMLAQPVPPLAIQPHEVIVSSEMAMPNQDLCVLQANSECRAQFQSMFQVHQRPEVVFSTAVSPPAGVDAGGVTETQAEAGTMLVSLTTRAETPQLARLTLDQVDACVQQREDADSAGTIGPAASETAAEVNAMFPRAAGVTACIQDQPATPTFQQSEANAQMGSMFDRPLVAPLDPLVPPVSVSEDVEVSFGRPCVLEAGSECQAEFASMFTSQHLPVMLDISTVSDQPCASYVGAAGSGIPDSCTPSGSLNGHRRVQASGDVGTVYVQVHARATSNAAGQHKLEAVHNCVARHAIERTTRSQLQECLQRGT